MKRLKSKQMMILHK